MVVSSSAGISVACPFSYYSEVAIRHPIKPKTVRSTVLSYIILVKVFQTQGQNNPELLTERFVIPDLSIYQSVAKMATPSTLLNILKDGRQITDSYSKNDALKRGVTHITCNGSHRTLFFQSV